MLLGSNCIVSSSIVPYVLLHHPNFVGLQVTRKAEECHLLRTTLVCLLTRAMELCFACVLTVKLLAHCA